MPVDATENCAIQSYAQTNLQLYRELLQRSDVSGQDLVLVRSAYELASRVFIGYVRGNQKPFIAHLVGTASVLVRHGRSIDEISAALLHACYDQGHFLRRGFFASRRGPRPAKRRLLQQATNAQVEQLILEFHRFSWDKNTLEAFQREGFSASANKKSAFIMRVANEIEEFLDDGMSFCSKDKTIYDRVLLDLLRELGKSLGCAGMVEELAALVERHQHCQLPAELVSKQQFSFVLKAPRIW